MIGIRLTLKVDGFSEFPDVTVNLLVVQNSNRHQFQFNSWQGGNHFLALDTTVPDARFDPALANGSQVGEAHIDRVALNTEWQAFKERESSVCFF